MADCACNRANAVRCHFTRIFSFFSTGRSARWVLHPRWQSARLFGSSVPPLIRAMMCSMLAAPDFTGKAHSQQLSPSRLRRLATIAFFQFLLRFHFIARPNCRRMIEDGLMTAFPKPSDSGKPFSTRTIWRKLPLSACQDRQGYWNGCPVADLTMRRLRLLSSF